MRSRLLTSTVLFVLISLGIAAQRQQTAAARATAAQMKTAAQTGDVQKARWMKELSNWGRWGKDDELGAVNHITAAKRLKALALPKTGTVVSLTRKVALAEKVVSDDLKGGGPGTLPVNFFQVRFRTYAPDSPGYPGYTFDMPEFAYHGQVYTHLDGLCHVSYEGKLYNGFSLEEAVDPEKGCVKEGIQGLKDGIITRGVLIDFPRLRGVSSLQPTDRLRPADVEAWEKTVGVKIAAGDAILLYTGWKEGWQGPSANYDPSMVTFLKERDVSVVGADRPAGDHHLNVVALGVNLIDNADLGPLAETAARLKRWEFLLIVSPYPTPGGTGSIANPLAIF